MRIDVDFSELQPGRLAQAAVVSAEGWSARLTQADLCVLVQGQPRDASGLLAPETLLMRYRRDGERFVQGLRGSYAIAVVDAGAGCVLACNDRMAVHGWCHAREGSRLRMAARADTIADGAALSPQAVYTYLFNHVIPAPDTVYEGVRRLPPAHLLRADAQGTTLRPHWEPVFAEPSQPDYAALAAEFKAVVRRSVERDAAGLDADRLGSFLSGGTDSSTVSGTLRQVLGRPVRAYSIGFDAEGYDEMEYARIAARHFGLDHREHYLSPQEVADSMPLVAAHYDQPFGNSSAVAAYHCARVAREDGCSALLAGDGGDELFGGNARYAKQALFGLYERVPAPLRSLALEPLLDNALAGRIPVLSKARSYVQQAQVPMPDRLQMYNLLLRLGVEQVLTAEFLAQVDPHHDMSLQQAEYRRSSGAALVNRMLAFDWKYTLADNDLPKVLGTTSLAGMATAFPLLCDEVIDFSLQLPAHYKLKGQKLRWFFKEALRGFLPEQIIVKRKQGFGLPFGVWALRDAGLARLVDDALGSFAGRGIVRPDFLRQLRRDLLQAHPSYYGELVWICVMLEFWLRQHSPDARLARPA